MERFQFNLTVEQKEFLEAKADETGVGKGAYLRMLLQSHMQKKEQMKDMVEASMRGLGQASAHDKRFAALLERWITQEVPDESN